MISSLWIKIFCTSPVGAGHTQSVDQYEHHLSIIVGSFKSEVSRQINRLVKDQFRWHRSFYDHRVRTEESLQNIREYIVNNPVSWDGDRENVVVYG